MYKLVKYICPECGNIFRMIVSDVKEKEKLALKARLICSECGTEMRAEIHELDSLFESNRIGDELVIYLLSRRFLTASPFEIVIKLEDLVKAGYTGRVRVKLWGEDVFHAVSCPSKHSAMFVKSREA